MNIKDLGVEDWFILIVIAGIIFSLSWCIGGIIFSDGKVDFCYVQPVVETCTNKKSLTLIGHIPWRPNREIQKDLESFEDASGKANQISCEIRGIFSARI